MHSFDLLISLGLIALMFSYTLSLSYIFINRMLEYKEFVKKVLAFEKSERIIMKDLQKPYQIELADIKGLCTKLVCNGKIVYKESCEFLVKRYVLFNNTICELYVGTNI